METELIELIFGATLHDIGKVVQRATNQKVKHSQIGSEFMKDFPHLQPILNHITYHHYEELTAKKLPSDHLAYITYIADNISSGIDRRDKEIGQKSTFTKWDTHTNQEDIFNRIYENDEEKRYYEPRMLDDREEINKAKMTNRNFNPGDYQAIVEKYKENLPYLKLEKGYINSLFSLLEGTLSYAPSSTNLEQAIDISLFDHMKLTGAIANSLYLYAKEKNITNFKERFMDQAVDFYKEDAFRLLSLDISGIQGFIYTIRDQRAARMLRSRSFYLEIFLENLIDELLEKISLTRANALYTGGGHAYLIVPNTEQAIQGIEEIEIEINQFLQEEFGHELFVAIASTPFSAYDAMGENNNFGEVYRQVGYEVSQKKLHRYSAAEIIALNERGKKVGRECSVCHRVSSEGEMKGEDRNQCSLCYGLIQFSPDLQKKEIVLINKKTSALPLGFNNYLQMVDAKELSVEEEREKQSTYSKNRFFLGQDQSIHLWIGEYTATDEKGKELFYDEFTTQQDGIDRLAVVRADVDDLGQAFISGLATDYNTLSRSATFSRSMSLFFKYHINQILKRLDISGTIIYSGGDDVFVLGDWHDMIRFSVEFRQEFLEYSQNKLTMSTGIGLFHPKTPVAIMATETGKLEEAAKANEKDSISLFTPENTFKWDDFIEDVWEDKLNLIQEFFEENELSNEYGKAFIYNLLTLIRQSFEESGEKRGTYKTMSWARWAYYLSQMEPSESSSQKLKNNYREFTRKLHAYFENKKDVKELEVALELYVYTIREE